MFNANARWDRRLPGSSFEGDIIEVAAIFKKGRIEPKFLILNAHKMNIEKINYYWKEKEGEAVLHHFSVTSNNEVYHIYFDNKSFLWRLKGI